MSIRLSFRRRRNPRLSAIRGYQRAASGAEAPPVVTQAVHALNSALIEKREGLRTEISPQ
jgi:hypothetical protein